MSKDQIKQLLSHMYSVPKDLKYIMQGDQVVRCRTIDDIISDLEDDLAKKIRIHE